MKFLHQTLQLLALCSSALASPCKVSTSSGTSASVTSTEEASLSTTLSLTVSESATTTSGSPSISTTTDEASLSTTLSLIISESATTTSAEPSTTTSDLPQQPTALLLNGDFEDNTVAPWIRSGFIGDPTISSSEAHGGSQSGYISVVAGGPANIGFRQILDSSLFEADKPYKFSVYVKITLASGCNAPHFISCDTGSGSQIGYFNTANISGPLNEWILTSITCSWNQARLDSGMSVAVRGQCERMTFFIDDATLVAVE